MVIPLSFVLSSVSQSYVCNYVNGFDFWDGKHDEMNNFG